MEKGRTKNQDCLVFNSKEFNLTLSKSEEPVFRYTYLSMGKVRISEKLFIFMTCGSGFEFIFY